MAALHVAAGFAMEISMVLESAINVLESPEGCCEDICTFCFGNINGVAAVGVMDWFYR